MTKEKLQIVQVGWQNEANFVPLVCMDKKNRNKLGIKPHDCVNVSFGKKKSIALVVVQFREHVGIEKVCTISTKLAKEIKVAEGKKVTIDTDVDKAEAQKLKANIPSSFGEFMSMLSSQGMRQRG